MKIIYGEERHGARDARMRGRKNGGALPVSEQRVESRLLIAPFAPPTSPALTKTYALEARFRASIVALCVPDAKDHYLQISDISATIARAPPLEIPAMPRDQDLPRRQPVWTSTRAAARPQTSLRQRGEFAL